MKRPFESFNHTLVMEFSFVSWLTAPHELTYVPIRTEASKLVSVAACDPIWRQAGQSKGQIFV